MRNAFGEIMNEVSRDVDFVYLTFAKNTGKLPLKDQMMIHQTLLPPDLLSKVLDPKVTTAQRCLLSARFFGDRTARQFWTLAIKYLDKYSTPESTKGIHFNNNRC